MSAETDQSCPFQSANERPEPISAEIKGIIPTWLTGTLIRIGPGRFECCETPLKHWLDGQGLLLHFHIEAGHVTYSNKFVRSDSYADTLFLLIPAETSFPVSSLAFVEKIFPLITPTSTCLWWKTRCSQQVNPISYMRSMLRHLEEGEHHEWISR